MRIAILQQNFVVGDIEGNTRKIAQGYKQARIKGADLVVSTELGPFGYPPKDMLERKNYLYLQNKWLGILAAEVDKNVGLTVGAASKNYGDGKPLFNSAVLIENGRCTERCNKALLPTYDVFDESRYFESGKERGRTFVYKGYRIAMLVCEDIWNGSEDHDGHKMYYRDPVNELVDQRCDILIVINGSPYYWGKGDVRFNLVRDIAKKLDCAVVYANQVGCQDELVFDGRSFAVNQYGRCIAAAKAFEEDLIVFDVDNQEKVEYPFDANRLDQLYDALVMGVRDYVHKSGFDSVVMGLSGGIDSALTACIAVDAFGARNVVGVSMPSEFSSDGSIEDARQLAENLGIDFHIIPINGIYDAFGSTLRPTTIGWNKPGDTQGDVTEENVQARIRGVLLMAFTNRVYPNRRFMLLTTGNKSEGSEGYYTMYGDAAGGYAPLIDVYKTTVYKLARYVNSGEEVIPRNTITKPPSAELRHNQKDTDSLPDYEILDQILKLHIEEQKSWEDIVALTGYDEEVVRKAIRLLNKAEYKRRQYPPGPKVTAKAFGSGRRWPITGKYLD
ncbi:MAG: NAD+ synthase [bacterium]|nr:NAD+ synthase [bacterium]